MCGLVAMVNFAAVPLDVPLLERMVAALAHRGPDDYGFSFGSRDLVEQWKEHPPRLAAQPGVALGHTRLSILDVSANGNQPFTTPDQRYWMVYNGEVFNFIELRRDLEKEGHVFRTESDTEVVLAAFVQWGTECFARFNGMWGLVIHDRVLGRVIASRDRLGIKPLNYRRSAAGWHISSEIKALLLDTGRSAQPNSRFLRTYLWSHRGALGGETFFDDVLSVEAGTWAEFKEGRVESHRYWGPPGGIDPAYRSVDEAAARFGELLRDAVRIQLRSDVRVGTMVSGGLDSTSVVSLIDDLLRLEGAGRVGIGDALHGFHARFPGLPVDEITNVAALQARVALDLHLIEPLRHAEVEALLADTAYSMERPFYRSVPMVHGLLMRCARDNGVKVVLNGHGADEVFAGYVNPYVTLSAAGKLRGGRPIEALQDVLGHPRTTGVTRLSILNQVLKAAVPNYARIAGLFAGRTAPTQQLLRPIATRGQPPLPDFVRGNGLLDDKLRSDCLVDILPHWLEMEDRISMSASVEARQPFLDHRLVEFGMRLPERLKVQRGVSKFILRKAMARYLPPTVINDARKVPYSGPDAEWLRGPLRHLLTEYFVDGVPRLEPFVQRKGLREFTRNFLANPEAPIGPLWRLFDTEVWLRRFFG